MKFRIESKKKPEPVVTLRLEQYDDDVSVVATRSDGEEHYLISFLKDGTLFLHGDINIDGIKVNKDGYIKTTR